MARASRDPWWACDATSRRSWKLAALPSDSARLGWYYLMGEAKLLRPSGRFASRVHFLAVMDSFGKYVDDYLRVGFLEEAPTLCDRCRETWGDVPTGTLVVHDWQRHQRDPGRAERAETWRSERPSNADRTHEGDALNADRTLIERASNADRTPNEQNSVAITSGDSRARAVTRTRTETESLQVTKGTKPARANGHPAEPLLTANQHDAWSDFVNPAWAPFKTAWLARGLRWPPAGEQDSGSSLRDVLWQIADARPNDLAAWVTEAKGTTSHSIVKHVLDRWHGVRSEAEASERAGDALWDAPVDAKAGAG